MPIPRFVDRDLILWGVIPCTFATAMVGMFALPNYMQARALKGESLMLKARTDEEMIAQNNLRNLERIVSTLRRDRDRRCRPLGDGVERDKLLRAITRTTDGVHVREQSIRTGQVVPARGMPADYQVLHREVHLEMTGTFDAIFGVLDAAEGIDQLVTARSVEISVVPTATDQAQTGAAEVRAVIVFDEWFEPAERAGSSTAAEWRAAPAAGSPLAWIGGTR
jgi:hypothetical protein